MASGREGKLSTRHRRHTTQNHSEETAVNRTSADDCRQDVKRGPSHAAGGPEDGSDLAHGGPRPELSSYHTTHTGAPQEGAHLIHTKRLHASIPHIIHNDQSETANARLTGGSAGCGTATRWSHSATERNEAPTQAARDGEGSGRVRDAGSVYVNCANGHVHRGDRGGHPELREWGAGNS